MEHSGHYDKTIKKKLHLGNSKNFHCASTAPMWHVENQNFDENYNFTLRKVKFHICVIYYFNEETVHRDTETLKKIAIIHIITGCGSDSAKSRKKVVK